MNRPVGMLLLALAGSACTSHVAALTAASDSPLAQAQPSRAEPAPSRADVMAYARRYVDLSWTAQASNVFHGRDEQNVQVDTPDAGYLASGWAIGPNVGVPYDWGGFDSPEEFLRKIAAGAPAGYVERTRDDRASAVAAGVDCSGLVARSWGLSKKHSTRSLPSVAVPLRQVSDLLPGDILNKPGAHVMLFERFVDDAKTRVSVIEAGRWAGPRSDGRTWKVVRTEYTASRLEGDGFVPLRDARRVGSRDERLVTNVTYALRNEAP